MYINTKMLDGVPYPTYSYDLLILKYVKIGGVVSILGLSWAN